MLCTRQPYIKVSLYAREIMKKKREVLAKAKEVQFFEGKYENYKMLSMATYINTAFCCIM